MRVMSSRRPVLHYDAERTAEALVAIREIYIAVHNAPHKHLPVNPSIFNAPAPMGIGAQPQMETYHVLTADQRQEVLDLLDLTFRHFMNPKGVTK